ncbi:MAG: sodium-dependent transporter [Selenomonas sp.]|jgi:NSS family neurotransmitter:Na+ symporter|nr:sodium-dependent transporter [Selenomonas sp.]MCI7330646.1 sodium-dependent transporter [Selenomonadaceae bacterium]MDD6119927.1 sodium-dependent transporter [Selenomonadaceae bacterium]MDD7055285.1 sodium-dependent transporter [Selenomonadaceae bacterium]MDY3917315.1 sodium-dependent transporter [Selenomonadaceae bacterium]
MASRGFSTRLGFILVSAGCAIGLGNVWRFPYITGQYGGASFVLIYLLFLAILGLPIMVSEFAVGRASQRSCAQSFDVLEPQGTKWHLYKYFGIAGNLLLMMYYTTVSGWMLYYLYKSATGGFSGLDAAGVGKVFGDMLADPVTMAGCMMAVVILGGLVCYRGVKAGVEKITKYMMVCLLLLMVVLAINSITLPNSELGLSYYLMPDFSKVAEYGWKEVIFAAMGQAFFTLSLGIGALAIFGSYIGKEKRLTGEAIWVIVLDTFVALMAGLIIFPACFSYGVTPSSGPNLLFVTLPNVFNAMPLGALWGTLFFLFMTFAAMSTVIAVFENLVACFVELTGADRKTIIRYGIVVVIVLSLPCVLGFNVLSGFQPFGKGSGVLDLEDFLVSNNILPLGSLVYLAFCTQRYGWGWKNFLREADTGAGVKFPAWSRFYLTYILPLVVLIIFANGYYALFFAK